MSSDRFWRTEGDRILYLKQTVLYSKGNLCNILHEIFEDATSINTCFLYSQLVDKCNPNLTKDDNIKQLLFQTQ